MMFSSHGIRDYVNERWEGRPAGMVSMVVMKTNDTFHFTKEGTMTLMDDLLEMGNVINPENIWEVETHSGKKGVLIAIQDRKLSDNLMVNPMCIAFSKLVSTNLALFTTDDDVVAKARDFSTKCGVVIEEEVEEKKPKKTRKRVRKTKTTKKD